MIDAVVGALGPILSVFGAAVIGGGVTTAFAYWLFRLFSEKWLANKFAERLENFKHEHQKELQRLRLEIDSLLDRTLKLHTKEFEVLPQAWSLMADAFGAMQGASIAFLQLPDLNRMSKPQFDDFISRLDWPDWQKTELREATDKIRYFGDVEQWRNLQGANRKRIELHLYLSKNGIFIEKELLDNFFALNMMMIEAYVEREMAMQHKHIAQKFDKAMALGEKGKTLFDQLQSDVQKRLWVSVKAG